MYYERKRSTKHVTHVCQVVQAQRIENAALALRLLLGENVGL